MLLESEPDEASILLSVKRHRDKFKAVYAILFRLGAVRPQAVKRRGCRIETGVSDTCIQIKESFRTLGLLCLYSPKSGLLYSLPL